MLVPDFDHRPLVEHYKDTHQQAEDPTQLDMEKLDKDLKGTRAAEGTEVVTEALAHLATGHVNSQELMAWIDDLRDPDLKDPEPVVPDGFLHDFEADTEFAGGALEDPSGKADDSPPAPGAENTDTSGGNDDDYFFSTTRKRNLGDDDDGDGDGETPADGEVKPAAVKAPKTKTTKKP